MLIPLRDALAGLWRMTRVNRCLLTNCALLAGFGFAGAGGGWGQLLLPALSIVFMYGSSSVLNDIRDMPVDRITNQERPLVRGQFGLPLAVALWAVLLLAGLYLAGLSAAQPFLVGFALLGIIYAFVGKRTIAGSVVLHGLGHVTLPFLAGYALVAPIDGRALIAGAFSAALLAPTFLIKDFKDARGDRLAGLRTLPVVHGREFAFRAVGASMLLTPLLGWVPWALLNLSLVFVLFYGAVTIWKLQAARSLYHGLSHARTQALYRTYRFVAAAEILSWTFAGV